MKRHLSKAFVATLVVAAAVIQACGMLPQRYVERSKPTATSRRLSPPVRVTWPEGVAVPSQAIVAYPAGTSREYALRDYLLRASKRGAGWVSSLSLTGLTEPACTAPLLPATIARTHDAAYLTERTRGRDSDYDIETRSERVDVPFLRALDDLDGIVEDVDIWTSNHPARCTIKKGAAFEITAGIHGRSGIGVRSGPERLDLTRCAGDPAEGRAAAPSAEDSPVLVLGSVAALDLANRVLPGWVHQRVLLEMPTARVLGELTRYVDGNLSVRADDGAWTYAHVLDAKAIARVDVEIDGTISGEGAEPVAEPDACQGWKAEPRDSF
ncbi:MAG: hypothetical protein CVU56_11065 [Deltaproteobacteria bacterium HGW-Deltaproteobacteria-14]|jgi:hypothetical protein|nr:MAG: hypothetical protein CVU56_11065 [Deltaproteobacteria bacterium HGW-Deltaproteobacteria-14]